MVRLVTVSSRLVHTYVRRTSRRSVVDPGMPRTTVGTGTAPVGHSSGLRRTQKNNRCRRSLSVHFALYCCSVDTSRQLYIRFKHVQLSRLCLQPQDQNIYTQSVWGQVRGESAAENRVSSSQRHRPIDLHPKVEWFVTCSGRARERSISTPISGCKSMSCQPPPAPDSHPGPDGCPLAAARVLL
jgi:hypothetical protein